MFGELYEWRSRGADGISCGRIELYRLVRSGLHRNEHLLSHDERGRSGDGYVQHDGN